MTKPALDDFDAVKAVVTALEGFDAKTQERILRWSREKLGLAVPVEQPFPSNLRNASNAQATTPPAGPVPTVTNDIKSFVVSKGPKSDSQFVATVAYYFQFEAPPEQRKESITGEDLQDACRKVGRARFQRVAQTLVNAHAQGLLDRGGERGAYSLNTVGENLVAMALPADGSGASVVRTVGRGAKAKQTTKQQKSAKKRPRANRRS